MSVRILSYPENYRVKKALVASQFNGVAIELPAFDMGAKQHKEESFMKVNPFGKVPTAFTSDSEGVFESASILRYIARAGEAKCQLYGKNILEASRIDSFLDVNLYLETIIVPWYYPLLGYIPLVEGNRDMSMKQVKTVFEGLNVALKGKDFLVGDQISIADIALTCSIVNFAKLIFTAEYLADVPELVRYINTNRARPQFKAVWGDLVLAFEKKE